MSHEVEITSIEEQFEKIIASEDKIRTREFLNTQNISDIAGLIWEYEEYATQIIASMSIHRAASVFKILDFQLQKTIIQELPPSHTAELLNNLPADDRTAFLAE